MAVCGGGGGLCSSLSKDRSCSGCSSRVQCCVTSNACASKINQLKRRGCKSPLDNFPSLSDCYDWHPRVFLRPVTGYTLCFCLGKASDLNLGQMRASPTPSAVPHMYVYSRLKYSDKTTQKTHKLLYLLIFQTVWESHLPVSCCYL